MITAAETRRLFGPVNRPDRETNVRHRALLRKPLELHSPEHLELVFGNPIHLRLVMGSAFANHQFGKIRADYVKNGRLISHETGRLDAQALSALVAYRDAFDAYFMKRGDNYGIRNRHAKAHLQDAEQSWNDWAEVYLAAHGRTRPQWALQPLPGLDRVRVTPTTPVAPAAPPEASAPTTNPLPTPPHSSPAPMAAALGSHLNPLDLSGRAAARCRRHGSTAPVERVVLADGTVTARV
ncbi:hypothetical protein C8J57DRAFT_1247324 [Mycena rebaudengoi]|nr:hypothetical protein C8J57DRAFT_1247324 [Mycena rebaudengoi]